MNPGLVIACSVFHAAGAGFLGAGDGHSGGALDGRTHRLLVESSADFAEVPLTVECWAKLESKKGFNVLVSFESKRSDRHWELYTYAGTGALSAYFPNRKPMELKSARVVADGQWHHVGLHIEESTAALFVDGEEVARQSFGTGSFLGNHPGPLCIGAALDGNGGAVGCNGLVDEVRIRKGLQKIAVPGASPLPLDAQTIGLWRLDGEFPEKGRDESTARGVARLLTLEEALPRVESPWGAMDVGTFVASTLQFPGRSNVAPVMKSVSVRLGVQGDAAYSFDTELLRPAAAWAGGFLNFVLERDGLAGPPSPAGEVRWHAQRVFGWSKTEEFTDPRSPAHGPLPRTLGRYEGLFTHGRDVVLSYTIDGTRVLELPGVEMVGGEPVFTRTLEREATSAALHALVAKVSTPASGTAEFLRCEEGDRVTLMGVTPGSGASLAALDGKAHAAFAPSSEPARTKISIWSGKKDEAERVLDAMRKTVPPRPLEPLTHGGPSRWGAPLPVKATLGADREAYTVDLIPVPQATTWKSLFFTSALDFLPDGRAAVSTVHGDVWLVSGLDASLGRVAWKRFAAGLFQPLGLKVVDGVIHVLGRDGITRLRDLNGDDECDALENLNNDAHVTLNGHEYCTNLDTDSRGNFYYTKCSSAGATAHDGSLLRVSRDGTTLDVVATGFRNPNGMGVGPADEITDADQEGEWMPATRLDLVKQGGFYGYTPSHHRAEPPKTYDEPLVWIPHEIDPSAGGQTWVTSKKWGPLEGKMLHLSYGKCQLFLVLQESVDGVAQGGVVRFPLRTACAIMRGRFHPLDGQLYVTGLRGWQTAAVVDGALERIRYTGKKVLLPVGLETIPGGVRLRFVEPLDPEWASDPDSYSVEAWNYRWTSSYGSKDWSPSDPERQGHDEWKVTRAQPSADGTSVEIGIEGLEPVMSMRLRYRLRAADGTRIQGDVHSTVHRARK